MKRSKPIQRSAEPMRRSGRLKPRSAKREAAYAGDDATEGRRAFVARILKERPLCEACGRIGEYLTEKGDRVQQAPGPDWKWRWEHCGMTSVDVHEILARSAGGSILDESNVLAVCRTAHEWIHAHPRESKAIGLLRSRYGRQGS